MRPVNLIPPEERRGESIPLRAGVASYVVVGVLAAALIAVVAIVLTGNSISEKKAELASLQAQQLQAQQEASKLAPYAQFASDSEARQQAVQSLADSRFDWQRVLREMALVIPDDVWLESLTGTVAPGVALGDAGGDSTSDPSITGPSLHVIGCGRSQDAVAGFLAALKNIDGVTRVGIQSSELGEATPGGADAAAPSGVTSDSGDCQTRETVAKFDVTIAFDAVPASTFAPSSDPAAVPATTTDPTATTDTTATPAASTTPPTTTPATTTTPTDGVSDGVAEQQSATDSANTQTDKAKNGASAVGAGN